ncbi:MAG: tetratricopeptide repeat protein [Alphaproteobacteria bacterium]|nr:tetratricopeptide repeat protein [Alphaproteobacteria bacterium SS10]
MDLARAEAVLRNAGKCQDRDIDLLAVAGAFALMDLPDVSEPVPLDPYERHFDQMATSVRHILRDDAEKADLATRLAAIRQVMVEEEGYRGDDETYDALQNANIFSVIERRRGLPVAIGLISMVLADRLGWTMSGLNFPGHFLLSFVVGREETIIDPFDGMSERQVGELRLLLKAHRGPDAELQPEHQSLVSRRSVLLRLRNNVKIRLLNAEDDDGALRCVEQMRLLSPRDPDLMREAAMLNIRLGKLQGAIQALSDAATADPDKRAGAEAASLADELRRKLN